MDKEFDELIVELRSNGKLMNRIANRIIKGTLTISELSILCQQFRYKFKLTKNEQ
jgi:hypothetical protein